MTDRMRIDRLLVERGVFDSRAKAQAAVMAGRVHSQCRSHRKAIGAGRSRCVALRRAGASLGVARRRQAGSGARALPARSAQSRLSRRWCIDGRIQRRPPRSRRAPRLCRRCRPRSAAPQAAGRPQIVSIEQTDIRELKNDQWPELPDFVCIDVSFISLKLVLPAALALARLPARLLALVKPQFEAGRGAAKKGIVRDPDIHEQVCADIAAFLRSLGWEVLGTMPSPIAGGDGNREFFIGAHRE